MASYVEVVSAVQHGAVGYANGERNAFEHAALGRWPIDRIASHRAGMEAGYVAQGKRLARVFRRDSNVVGALGQRILPWKGCDAKIECDDDALRDELSTSVAAQLTEPIIADIAEDLAMCGLAVLHHPWVRIGDKWMPDVRVWDLESIEYRGGWYWAYSREKGWEPIEDDPAWTIIRGHNNVPHEHGAVIPLAMSVAARTTTLVDRNGSSRAVGSPKLIGTLPAGVAVKGEDGIGTDLEKSLVKSMMGALASIVVSNGTKIEKMEFNASGLGQFYSETVKLDREDIYRAIILQPGTANAEGGNYVKEFGMHELLYNVVKADTADGGRCITHGLLRWYQLLNRGTVNPSARLNYPLPDPDEDARITAHATRIEKATAIIEGWMKAGFAIGVEDVARLERDMQVKLPALNTASKLKELFAYHQRGGIFTKNEIRGSRGYEPLANGGEELVDETIQQPSAGS